MSVLRDAIDSYIALRRSVGFKLREVVTDLRSFASFMEKRNASYVTSALALEWAMQPRDALPSRWAQKLCAVRGFAKHWSASDGRTEIPDRGLLPHRPQRREPYIYSDEDVERLLEAAKRLTPENGLRPCTYYCLLGLLAVTGLRIGEALRLRREDVDLARGVLMIRQTKFGKTRLVPLHASTTARLAEYATRRDSMLRTATVPCFLTDDRGRALCPVVVEATFRSLTLQVGLRSATHQRKPRLQDLRHAFAVKTLVRWYRAGEDVERRLPALSTYLGHAHVEDTYWYLSLYPELMKLAAERYEKRWEMLQ